VNGVVTTNPTLIDPSGRLLIIQDSTAAIEVRLPVAGTAGAAGLAGHPLVPGARLQVSGSIGRSYGAPRLTVSTVIWLGSATQPQPLRITAAPGSQFEWRLVQASGRFDAIHRLGVRWRADLIIGSTRIPVVGLTGSRIAVGRLLVGRRVTIVGIVRRAYPSAIDQRFVIDPRSMSDMSFEPADPIRPTPTDRSTGARTAPGPAAGVGGDAPTASGESSVDLRDLNAHRGQQVRVGGLVTGVKDALILLDDGTATRRLILTGAATPYLDLVEIGDPLEVVGLVEVDASGPYLLVSDPNGVARAGDPGPGTIASAGPSAGPTSRPETSASRQVDGSSTIDRSAGFGPANLLEALGLTLVGVIVALAIVLPLVRRRGRMGRQAGPDDDPRARPTLGPS
jgi:hypothetical protein